MSLGLSHSLSRHKLKFSPDKVDTMIVQAIALLDDLDKELNTYAMRVKEWYGWHFPEMGRILNDNLAYARVILAMGLRTNAAECDLSDILPEEIESAVKAAAEVSMGTEITTEDLSNIQALGEQVIDFTEYRQQLSSYLSARMAAVAPNLTALVGDLVGARLIAHAGSLMNLAKSPASTIQILGAEKALFRALKTKHDTPKYGLIYHASLIGQASGKNKGKIARALASKAAIGIRVDALADWSAEGEGKGDMITEEEKSMLGVTSRLRIERRLANLEGKPLRSQGVSIGPNGVSAQPKKWEVKEARKYNPDADGLAGNEPAATAPAHKPSSIESPKKKKLIEEIKDVEMNDADGSDDEQSAGGSDDDTAEDRPEDDHSNDLKGIEKNSGKDESIISTVKTKKPSSKVTETNGTNSNGADENDDKSETISTVSADSPDSPDSATEQEINWQSSILGNTKEAKKARKKERHARKLALSEGRSLEKSLKNEKLKRRLDRKERRTKRANQIQRREDGDEEKYRALARQAGLPISRYKRKLERGEIKFDVDGTPVAISKKDIKRARKEAEKAAAAAVTAAVAEATNVDSSSGKKRKRAEELIEKPGEKKRKRKGVTS